MLLSDRRFFLLGCAALAGCGYSPVYAPGGSASGLIGNMRYADPTDENQFNLVRRFEERLGRNPNAAYQLDYDLDLQINALGITPNQKITRYNVLGTASFAVRNTAGETLTTGQINNFTSYSASGTTAETQTAGRDAYARLMVILADQIVSRLLATSGDWMP